MHTETKRVFVPNLPENVTEEEIRKRFFKYGDITSVEIKFRKEVNARNHSHQYVFVNIETTPKLLQQCFDEFAHKKWNGQWVEVQLAKESFLEKLRREREENQQANGYAETTETKSVAIKTNGKRNSTENLESPKKKIKQASSSSDSDSSSSSEDEKSKKKPVTKANQTITPKVTKKVKSAKSSSDSDSSSSSEDEKSKKKPSVNTSQTNTTKTTKKGKTETSDSDSSSDDEKEVKKKVDVPLDYVVKSNKHKKADNKIEGVGLAPIHVQTSVVKKKSKDPYREQADKKRMESMMNMRQGYMQQKSLIKNALSNVDNKQSTKITFNDDNEPIIEKSVESTSEKPQKKDKKSKKLPLFEGNDDEDDGKTSFKLRDEYEGKKGQKLFEMQQRFNQDDRFKLDARFADESNDDGDPQTEADQPVDELSMQMQVLGEVLKQPVVKHSEKGPRKSMLRFDPSQPEHSKYKMEDPRKDASSKTKKEKKKKKKNEVDEEVKLPEVSAETFYEVSTNIPFQESGEGEGFSLLKALGRDQDDEIYGDQNVNDQEMEESYNNEGGGGGVEKKKKKKVNGVQNAFKYDSSDDDDDKEVSNDAEKKEDIQDGLQERKGQLFWSERFFFKRDDYRLQEGVDFVKRMHLTTGEDNFSQVRQGLKNLVHRKMSTVYKKSRPPPPKHKRLSKNAYNNQKRRRKAQTRTSRSNP